MENKIIYNKHNTFFLDSNIIISLTKLYFNNMNISVLINNKDTSFNGYEGDGLSLEKAKSIKSLFYLIRDKKIKCFISPVVYDEVTNFKHDDSCVKLMKLLGIDIISYESTEMKSIVEKLSDLYFTTKSSANSNTAFEIDENKKNWKNDALIMAFASYTGIDIITNDKHFLCSTREISYTNHYASTSNEITPKHYFFSNVRCPDNVVKKINKDKGRIF